MPPKRARGAVAGPAEASKSKAKGKGASTGASKPTKTGAVKRAKTSQAQGGAETKTETKAQAKEEIAVKSSGSGSDRYVVIESAHTCSTYKSQANKLLRAMEAEFAGLKGKILVFAGRRNSFEVALFSSQADADAAVKAKSVSGGALLWTGVNKGPPRKLKWPDHDVVLKALKQEMA